MLASRSSKRLMDFEPGRYSDPRAKCSWSHGRAYRRRQMRRWPLLIACLLVGACDSNKNDPSAPGTGAIDVTVSGLPGGVHGAVTVTGGGGFSRTLTATGKV